MATSRQRWLILLSAALYVDADLFKTFPGTLKFSDASTYCQNQGMVLPVLTSPLAQSLALAALPATPESEYWIGLDYMTGNFRWGDNSGLCWENWFISSANEPNKLASELCVAMRGGGSIPGAWLTKNCDTNFGIICQQYQQRPDDIYKRFDDVIPTSVPLSALPVWTESACVLQCDLTTDCNMATYDPTSGLCSVYNCTSHVTSSPGRVTWINQ